MIREALNSKKITNVSIEFNTDSIYNDHAWIMRVQSIVATYESNNSKVAIIGHDKDVSSWYMNAFPQWHRESVDLIEPLHSTDIRELYFRQDVNMNFIQGVVPSSTFNFLEKFRETEDYQQVLREREFIATYKKQYAGLAYPPVFVTTDAVVVQSGHVLMIQRKAEPGKNLMALPGGFLDQNELIVDGAIRELKEETKIKVPVPVLKGSIKKSHVFDHPNRSARGRTITHAFFIELPDGILPKVTGSDDAAYAKWVPISELDSRCCFEDHAEIISFFTGT